VPIEDGCDGKVLRCGAGERHQHHAFVQHFACCTCAVPMSQHTVRAVPVLLCCGGTAVFYSRAAPRRTRSAALRRAMCCACTTSVAFIQVEPPGHFIHVPITTPIASALKNYYI
jgi:hypothetical protein